MHTRLLLVPPTYYFFPSSPSPFFFNPSLPGSHFGVSAEMPLPQRIYFLTVKHHPQIFLGQPLSAAKATCPSPMLAWLIRCSYVWCNCSHPSLDCKKHKNWASLVAQMVKTVPQCGRPRFDPWVGKIPWRRERLPTPVFLPGELHGQSSWGHRVGHDWATLRERWGTGTGVSLSGLCCTVSASSGVQYILVEQKNKSMNELMVAGRVGMHCGREVMTSHLFFYTKDKSCLSIIPYPGQPCLFTNITS